ncbi:MAG: hypothetical protein QF404_01260 [Planctomycetota bacterium]|nr:hypothetical protein [Planctomycetota bacterium]
MSEYDALVMKSFRLAIALAGTACPALADAPEMEIGPTARGETYTWQAANGLRYEYFIPKDYDHGEGAALTLIMHGSNLDRRWGFANHAAGEFRPHDIVVSPDGTTSNGSGGFNSLQRRADLERMHELHEELKSVLNVRATYLYGHSQGSFFSFYYAGAYPGDVQGLVGQASGVWIGTEQSRRHHHQAVVLMHGTADPVVSYGQSVGGHASYVDARYPLVRLRSLDGWNHWPHQNQTEQQLAWVEGMTTTDAEALEAAFETLDGMKEWRDPVALYQVARRLVETEGASKRARNHARRAVREVEELARRNVKAIERSLGKGKGDKLSDDAWVGQVPLFLRHFRGVDACDDFSKKWQKRLERHATAAKKHGAEYYRVRERKPADAFEAGIELVNTAFLRYSTAEPKRLDQLERWREDAKGLKLKKSVIKSYDQTVPVYRSALEKGAAAFKKANGPFG